MRKPPTTTLVGSGEKLKRCYRTTPENVFLQGNSCVETPLYIVILRNRSYLRRFSDCEFSQLVTRVRPLEWSIILHNLLGNCRSARASRLLPSNFSATDPTRISPFGDEVAPFSAARRSAKSGTNAFVSPRSFGCGCAALSYYLKKSAQQQPILPLNETFACKQPDSQPGNHTGLRPK